LAVDDQPINLIGDPLPVIGGPKGTNNASACWTTTYKWYAIGLCVESVERCINKKSQHQAFTGAVLYFENHISYMNSASLPHHVYVFTRFRSNHVPVRGIFMHPVACGLQSTGNHAWIRNAQETQRPYTVNCIKILFIRVQYISVEHVTVSRTCITRTGLTVYFVAWAVRSTVVRISNYVVRLLRSAYLTRVQTTRVSTAKI
jgi:hypothetical protein